MASYNVVIIILAIQLAFLGKSSAELTKDHYDSTCPQFKGVVRDVVKTEFQKDPRMLASILRLHFHDCFVNGCDGSNLLNDTTHLKGERGAGPNVNSLRGFHVIDSIKTNLKKFGKCKDVVSCADILALAAMESVAQLGGPKWDLGFGRRDGYVTVNSVGDAYKDLPGPGLNIDDLKKKFSALNFTTTDLVALSGAHTVGKARCINFRARIYNETATINSAFAAKRREKCPYNSGIGDNKSAPLDIKTQSKFDNNYYKDLVAQKGLLHSDQELHHHDAETTGIVNSYSIDQADFFAHFSRAMTKMSLLKPLTGKQGEIRKVCHKVNS